MGKKLYGAELCRLCQINFLDYSARDGLCFKCLEEKKKPAVIVPSKAAVRLESLTLESFVEVA